MAKVTCPNCHSKLHWNLSDARKKCQRCHTFFRPTLSRFRFSWYQTNHLIEYFCLGIPVYRLKYVAPFSRQTVGKFFRFLRQLIYDQSVKELEELRMSGEIEMDETMFGGRRPGKRGWGAAGKQIVFGIYRRNGQVATFPISTREASALMPIVGRTTVPEASLYYTDDWRAYGSLPIRGNRVVVSKRKGRPSGKDHLNGIEGFWSYAKHWLYQYRGVPKQYFHLYLKEVEFRFNHRKENLIPIVKRLVKEQIGADI